MTPSHHALSLLQERSRLYVPDLARLGVENLFHQVAGHGAGLGGQLPGELLSTGAGARRDRGQAEASRPAPRPAG